MSFKNIAKDPVPQAPKVEIKRTMFPGTFPNRDPKPDFEEPEKQISVRAKVSILRAFKELSEAERRTYGDMLRVLMEAYGPPRI